MTQKTKLRFALATALLICSCAQFGATPNEIATTPPPQKAVTTIAPIEVTSKPQAPKQEVNLYEIPEPTLALEPEIPSEEEPLNEPSPQPEAEPEPPTTEPNPQPEAELKTPTIEENPQPKADPEPQPTTPPTSVLTPTEPAPSDDMIWVAGFGWLPSGEPAVSIEMDSTGDINKMVGIM